VVVAVAERLEERLRRRKDAVGRPPDLVLSVDERLRVVHAALGGEVRVRPIAVVVAGEERARRAMNSGSSRPSAARGPRSALVVLPEANERVAPVEEDGLDHDLA
jgi:hypothetical protein